MLYILVKIIIFYVFWFVVGLIIEDNKFEMRLFMLLGWLVKLFKYGWFVLMRDSVFFKDKCRDEIFVYI